MPETNPGSYQVHSITARSVSREFREGLKMAKPELTDAIMKVPRSVNNKEITGTKYGETVTVMARPGMVMAGGEGGEHTRWEA